MRCLVKCSTYNGVERLVGNTSVEYNGSTIGLAITRAGKSYGDVLTGNNAYEITDCPLSVSQSEHPRKICQLG